MSSDLVPLIDGSTKFRVSSVLNKDTKSYGKQFLADGKEETCWNSDQGAEQWIVVNFEKKVRVKKIEIKFQGGFCAAQMRLEILNAEKKFHHLSDFYPQDSNSSQCFEVDDNEATDCYRIYFEKLTDFFGRLIVYNFQLYGTVE